MQFQLILTGRSSSGLLSLAKSFSFSFIFVTVLLSATAWGAVGGSISGTIKDPSGGVIPGAMVTATNVSLRTQFKTMTDSQGYFSFPNLTVGRYDLNFEMGGFKPQQKRGLIIDINTALEVNVSLEMGEISQEVSVSADAGEAAQVETVSTQLGELVTGKEMTMVALNGRSFTDLLALQPGIVPMTTQQPDSIVMAGASVAIQPSGTLNPGNQSISGQREDANGFLINGGDVKELMNGGTSVVPNLDSIQEFRVLTNNFDAEYGNYSGGIVNVVTKSGENEIHGSGFEFLRNTALDARNFFSPERGFFRQNQFGGTLGGAIFKDKLFYFGDYQGTRTNQGIDTGLISVPSLANRIGNLSGQTDSLTGKVAGPYLANFLSQKLGYAVRTDEPYYTPACTSSAQCVFPNAFIPQRVWSEPAKHLLQYIPLPNVGDSVFSTASQGKKLRDDKGSFRLDGNSAGLGFLSAYYFFDDYRLNNPYPSGQGGATVPGFAALNLGRSQLFSVSQAKAVGLTGMNELHFSFMRNANNVGQPSGGVGPTLASQGFVTGPGTPGIVPLAPRIEGIENVVFTAFTMGTPITNLTQANNTYSVSNNFSKVLGVHSLKAGFQMSYEQVNVNPNPTFNGSFAFFGTETGLDFADFLIGVASNYNQADSQTFYGRHKYASAFLQDTWKVRPSVTLNYGVRWDLMQYWSEKFNQIPTFVLGKQSQVYPTAPTSLLYPTDPGVPRTLVPQQNKFAPRIGIAYSPSKSAGLLGKIIGGSGKTSIRAGFGLFYSVIEGNTIAIDEPQPPYGSSYTSPAPPLFATPFISAADGAQHVQPFPLKFPPLNATRNHPNPNIDFSPFLPQAGMTAPIPSNTYPYNENYFLSIERQLTPSTLFSISYAGSQAHHLLLIYSANPGNPALCLALSKPSAVAPGTPTCKAFGEDTTYTAASGQIINGTRGPLGPNFHNDDYEGSIGNSNYNSLQASIRRAGTRLDFSAAYTFSKSIDQASSISDPVDPFDFRRTRALSAFDLKHSFVTNYQYQLPLAGLLHGPKALTDGWAISGITRISSGFPVSLHSDGDNSLMGSLPNGVNNHSIDRPDFIGGPLNLNHDPRNGLPYFNTSLFPVNELGSPGTASRRSFYGPGMFNCDIALLKTFKLDESKQVQFRLETFNTFNHAQFFGPVAVDGDVDSRTFGQVIKAAPPRLMQLAAKITF
jgi:hypothetical protein